MVTQFDPLDRFEREKFQILKIQDGGGHHLKKSKNHHTLYTVWLQSGYVQGAPDHVTRQPMACLWTSYVFQ